MSVPLTPAVEGPKLATKTRAQKWLRRGLWFLGLCVVLEIGLRAFGYGSYVVYRPDERLLWVPLPGEHRVTEINHEPETINPQGFRYRQALTLQHPGIYRIFTFGDSVTMGWGVGDNANYSARLENLLNSQSCSGTRFQVISAGVNAYPNSLVVERLKKVLEDGYQPDAVVLAYSANTGFEGIPDLRGEERERFLKKVELKSVARRSALYNFLIEGVLRQVAYYRFRELLMLGTWNTAKSSPDLPASHFLEGLEQAKAATEAHHVQLILLLLGSRGEPYPAHPYQQAMLDFARANNIPLVNIIDLMKDQDQNVVFMDHVHPSAKGHIMIAEQLASMLRGLDSYNRVCKASNGSALTSLTTKSATAQP
jgi:lysophospholipase L1-like esterase